MPIHQQDSNGRTRYLERIGPYEILEELGRGGMGVVYKAFHASLNRPVAVKVLGPHLAEDAPAVARFVREARSAAAINHPNVITVHDVDADHDPPYLVMEYVDGPSLQRLLDSGPLEVPEIVRLGLQTAAGLAAAHARGLIHRDLKPANILLASEGQLAGRTAKIADFGLARSEQDERLTASGALVGTVPYMSPEQAAGKHLDHRSDLFSLGSVLYALCTGHPPFEGDTLQEVLGRICHQVPPKAHEVNPTIPAWLGKLIEQLHAAHPARRCQSADEVVRVLETKRAEVVEKPLLVLPAREEKSRGPATGGPWAPATRSSNQLPAANGPEFRPAIAEVQRELRAALEDMLREVGTRLKPQEKAEIESEFDQLNTLLERLQTGLIWVALFGIVNSGKSAIANALLEQDRAVVGPRIDLTTKATYYEKPPWVLVDVPGVMGNEVYEQVAVTEARKAHAHVFVINGEPYGPELKLFNLVHNAMPDTPKLVFVNKWDKMQHVPSRDREEVKGLIQKKMARFVKSPEDILFGSAEVYDPTGDVMVRQQLPQLLQRMYEDAGTFGELMNVLDPARRAGDLGHAMRERILQVRLRVARKVIAGFAAGSLGGGFIPFSQLLVEPGILAGMVYTLFRIMGKKEGKGRTLEVARELLTNCAAVLGAQFAAHTLIDTLIGVGAIVLGPLGGFLALAAGAAGLGYFKYRRTVILGEVTLEYIRNDCSWGGEDPHAVILRCKERAKDLYIRFKRDGKE